MSEGKLKERIGEWANPLDIFPHQFDELMQILDGANEELGEALTATVPPFSYPDTESATYILHKVIEWRKRWFGEPK